jgi:hypothetical protein
MKKYFVLFTILAVVGMLSMGIYTVKPTRVTTNPDWYGGILQFDGQFVAATDTFYFPFTASRPKNVQDTIAYALSLGASPLSTARDTVDVYWGLQFSDDNSNWSSLTALATDSTKTGTVSIWTWKYYVIGTYVYGGIHPYYRVVAIGKTVSGGANNIIGNHVRVFALKQSSQ